MATNRTTTKSTTTTPDTTEAKPSTLSRFFSRNGHDKQAPPPVKPQGPPKSVWREYFESAVVTVIMALFGMTFIVQAVKVPTGSMQNTITIGDRAVRARKSSTSPVSTTPPPLTSADAATDASTTDPRRARCRSAAARRASSSVSGMSSQPCSRRFTLASRGPLPVTTSATTVVGTTNG